MTNTAPHGLRIGIDGFNLAMPRGTGVATYGRILSQALHEMDIKVDVLFGLDVGAKLPPFLQEIVFFDRFQNDEEQGAPPIGTRRWRREWMASLRGADATTIPVTGRVLATQFTGRLPVFDRLLNIQGLFATAMRHFHRTRTFLKVRVAHPPAIMHWTYPLPIRLIGSRNIYTLHDLVPLRLPYTTLDHKRRYLRLVQDCVRHGDHICTVSEASRQDIIALLAAPPGQVTNTYQAAGLPAPPEADLTAWLGGLFGLQPQSYYLFSAAIEPKKNVARMIEAFLASAIAAPLVIVAGPSWHMADALRLATDALRETGRIKIIPYVPGPWLAALVRGARAVLFPSLYEGFGLPVLEALQLGTPVITANTSSLPEIAGAAALLVDPYDTAALMQAIRRIDTDPALRRALAAAGPVQAAQFDMAHYQRRLRAMYDRVLAP